MNHQPPTTPGHSAVNISPSNRSLPAGTRRCPRCERDLPLRDFALDRSKASGRKSHCQGCDSAKSKRYYAENRERVIARVKARHAELQEQQDWRGRRRRGLGV
jgi:hypothetical protein